MLKKLLRNIRQSINASSCKTSYAQCGEDIITNFLFTSVGIAKPTYLDIGANNPSWCSNSYLFYKKGCTGVLVEADETIIPLIKKVRPRDKILNVGVGFQSEKEADFYIFDVKALNTFSKEEAQQRAEIGTHKISKVVKVALKTINEIISENFDSYPDFMSIDIEGLDLAVLKTLDIANYPIPVICAETCTYSENHMKPKDSRIKEFMHSKGYFEYADTYVNSVFVNENWFKKII
ncbi:MAG: FkbM family methyltransferase [Bacteroidota bacterium]|nr:FkbM family methyltransferase [Bacteroidota bacterium]